MKKVLIITYYWPPSGGAGVQRWLKFVKYLPEFNILPIVLTVNPKKASFPVIDESLAKDIPENIKVYTTNTFEPNNWYKKLSSKKEIPYAGFANESNPSFFQKAARFVRGNFFIPDARIGWNKYAYPKALEIIQKENISTVITTSPPHSTQLIGLKLKKEKNIQWIADLRDPWTDIYYYKYMQHTKAAKQKDAALEQAVLEQADSIVVVSKSIKKLFASKSEKIKESKIHIIPNGFDSSDFSLTPEKNNKELTISYTGTITNDYPVNAFIEACKNFDSLKINFVGKQDNSFRKKFSDLNTSFTNHVSHKESTAILQKSDALLLIIPKIEGNKGILTGKLFEYLAAKKPIICIGPKNGDAAKIIEECKAGKCFDYNDAENIKNYLKEIPNINLSNNNTYMIYERKNLTKILSELL